MYTINADPKFSQFKTIFRCIAGSHLYGTATPESDTDIRGVFIPTKEYFYGFAHKIEQIEEHKQDIVHFDIRKFFALALECNPNIVELLFVPESQWIIGTWEWKAIVSHRAFFLSKKARYTFSGYAISQLHRIKQHRNWLLNPPKKKPVREDFGLPSDVAVVTKEQINAFDQIMSIRLNEKATDFVDTLNSIPLLETLKKERHYLTAKREWDAYDNWKSTRNPARASIEAKFGYDVKHGAHLFRLISEGEELLTTGAITFPRPDFEELIAIRNGKYSYEQLLEQIGDLDTKFDKLYEASPLPHHANANKTDELCISIVKEYIET